MNRTTYISLTIILIIATLAFGFFAEQTPNPTEEDQGTRIALGIIAAYFALFSGIATFYLFFWYFFFRRSGQQRCGRHNRPNTPKQTSTLHKTSVKSTSNTS